MAMLTAAELQGRPIRLHGIQLGRVADVLLDPEGRRALGFDVACGDAADRFLPWSAVHTFGEELEVDSALPLLEDVAFYRRRAQSFRALTGVARAEEQIRDLVFDGDGSVTAVVLVEDQRPPGDLPLAGSTEPVV